MSQECLDQSHTRRVTKPAGRVGSRRASTDGVRGCQVDAENSKGWETGDTRDRTERLKEQSYGSREKVEGFWRVDEICQLGLEARRDLEGKPFQILRV